MVTIDGNEAAAYVAYKTSEVISIYPITPSSPMAELADEWATKGKTNLWGTIPLVAQMQSEAGAAGALHGALQAGSLATTFTASQGLLLMIPTMFKLAGELNSTVFHIAARTVATHALSIFCDHSDVMATRSTGFAFLSSCSVQEVMDLALIAHSATLQTRVPFIHFFDGFRTSHEVMKIERLGEDDIRSMIDEECIAEHRSRALTPERPVIRGTAQNPDIFFQAREASNPFYLKCPVIVQERMDKFETLTGRRYELFQYEGAPDAERVMILMGSGCEAAAEAVGRLRDEGQKVGLVRVRLYRPFSSAHLMKALPASTKAIACLDRTKEPGSVGEPLYTDVATSVLQGLSDRTAPFEKIPKVVGGRYGLSSKEFTPAMAKAVLDELKKELPKNHFTVGITDDIAHASLAHDPSFSAEGQGVIRAVFYGLGADGTVGANKNSIKIIGEETPNFAQGYFVYDSKKSGSRTVSHLRFGPGPIHSSYLIEKPNFIACNQPAFLHKFDMLSECAEGGIFLLNTDVSPEGVWETLPRSFQENLIRKKMKFLVVDAYRVAREAGLGGRINTVMQTCFFAISGVLPREEAVAKIKESIQKTYGKRGDRIVQMNFAAVDGALAGLHEVTPPVEATSRMGFEPAVLDDAPAFVKMVTAAMIAGRGDELPVSAMPVDGTFPVGTTQWEKRNIALEIPIWDEKVCIHCGKCSMICPHATIRMKVYDHSLLGSAPEGFKWAKAKGKEFPEGFAFTVQVAPEQCTGCSACVSVCPAKDKTRPDRKAINMYPQPPLREREAERYSFFLSLPEYDRTKLKINTVKGSQLLRPLFEYSGACAGCGETPYVRLLSQLFGDRALISNATGCSSIYSGNLPTHPYTTDGNGRGPAWSNPLFEDCAEFGMGLRLAVEKNGGFAAELLRTLSSEIGPDLADAIIHADQRDEKGISAQRERVAVLREKLNGSASPRSAMLSSLADFFVKKSVWCIGGDGWAYDIGYGGLDQVLSMGLNVNVLVLDTEVYSNTGGQVSKATPRAAVAKFAAAGKTSPKKDLGLMMMTYRNIYIAQVAIGASDTQTVKAFMEAEAYEGPSLIIAYSHCLAHGTFVPDAFNHQKAAVDSGYWPLYRFNPALIREGKNPLILDSGKPKIPIMEFVDRETRYKMLSLSRPEEAKRLFALAQIDANAKWRLYEQLASLECSTEQG